MEVFGTAESFCKRRRIRHQTTNCSITSITISLCITGTTTTWFFQCCQAIWYWTSTVEIQGPRMESESFCDHAAVTMRRTKCERLNIHWQNEKWYWSFYEYPERALLLMRKKNQLKSLNNCMVWWHKNEYFWSDLYYLISFDLLWFYKQKNDIKWEPT